MNNTALIYDITFYQVDEEGNNILDNKGNTKIYRIKEGLRVLNHELDNIQLENDYLSSPIKLLEYQAVYFDEELVKKDIQKLKKIKINEDKIIITNFELKKN